VETPEDAIQSFLYSMGSIEMLVMGSHVVRRKKPSLKRLLGEVTKDGDLRTEPALPKRSGPAEFQSTFEVDDGSNSVDTNSAPVQSSTKVRMPDRPMHGLRNEWFDLLDELEVEVLLCCDGTRTLNDIMGQYTTMTQDQEVAREQLEDSQALLQNIVHRLVRLYEHTFVSW
jgi:hypothetical protein